MSTSTQFNIEVKPSSFSQTLYPHGTTQNWSFPVDYYVPSGDPAAEVAEINIDGAITVLQQGLQTVTGTGLEVDLIVDLGTCPSLTISANPFKESDCPYPFISKFFAGGDGSFQVLCATQSTAVEFAIGLSFVGDAENPPPTADVTLDAGGQSYAVPVGSSTLNPTGTTFVFNVANFQGDGKMKIAYTYTLT